MSKTIPCYIDYYVGHKLKMIRLKQEKRLQDLAQFLDVSFQQIQKYEKGYNKLSGNTLYNLAQFFNTPINYFFDGMPKADDTNSNYDLNDDKEEFIYHPPKNISDSELLVLVKNYSKIKDAAIRRKILDLVKAL